MTDATAAEPTGGQTRDLSGARDMIVCEDVSKWYGDFQALDKVSATIKEQEVVVVLGPSGSGKSTWIRCINRLEIHQEGRIVVDDVELTNDLRNIEKVRSEVGMVFQQFNLFPHLTILDNVTLAPIWVRKSRAPKPNPRPCLYWNASASPNRPTSTQVNCREDSNSGWRSPGPWLWSHGSCCSTSQPRPSTQK